MDIRIAVIGGGSWGTTVAHLAAQKVPTVLWARRPEQVEEINRDHTNSRYLPGFSLHPELTATDDLRAAVQSADVIVMGVPSQGFRSALELVAEHVRAWVPIMSLTKGLEQDTRLRMTQIINEVVPGHPAAVLTGPNLAKEILAGDAAAAVIATQDPVVAECLQEIFHQQMFRVYVNRDVIGCEVAGALKNVDRDSCRDGRWARCGRQHEVGRDHPWAGGDVEVGRGDGWSVRHLLGSRRNGRSDSHLHV